jgi:hypothetical protein
MGYTAMAVGPHDLSGGLDLLNKSVMAGSPWISANIITHDNKLIFPPWIIHKADGVKVGFIGLTSTEAVGGEEYEIADWQQVLPRHVEELLLECDFLVLLSNLQEKQNEQIALRFPQIHLIVASDYKKGNIPPRMIHNTIIAQTHTRGKYLGIIKVSWSNIKIWQLVTNISEIIQQRLLFLQEKYLTLQKSSIQSEMDQRHLIDSENKALLSLQKDTQSGLMGTYSFRFLPLSEQVPEDKEIENKVLEAKREISRLNKHNSRDRTDSSNTKAKVNTNIVRGFAGPKSCLPCHNDQVSRWQQTAHANSMANLSREMQQYNLRCLPCHVTHDMALDGSQEISTHLLSLPDEFRMVGCESCHGQALKHIKKQEQNVTLPKVTETTCRNCHTEEMDPTFNFLEKMKQIPCTEKRE